MMHITVISCSLHPTSKSRLLGRAMMNRLTDLGAEPRWVDLRDTPLPPCDGAEAYGDPAVGRIKEVIAESDAILLACPIYNYDVNAAAKNLIELTGKAWTDKVVGFTCAAGGSGSYMSLMGVSNSLMLDFHCLIVPRFVYATGRAFEGEEIVDEDVQRRLDELARLMFRLGQAMRDTSDVSA